jgi:hypothetical protein
MPEAIGSLWSPAIKPGVQTPLAIIKQQARAIEAQTNDLVRAEVNVTYEGEANAVIALDIYAPMVSGQRHRILEVRHERLRLYPARVDAECFPPQPSLSTAEGEYPLAPLDYMKALASRRNEAASDEQLRKLVEQALQYHQVTALVISLLALSGDQGDAHYPPPPPPKESGEPPQSPEGQTL